MKNIYKSLFLKYSPFFLAFMLLVLWGSYNIRTQIALPTSISNQATFFNKFAITKNFVESHSKIFFNIEFFANLSLILIGFFLGTSIAGKTQGLFIAIFLGFYPYFIHNCYSSSNFFMLFFMLYLFFQIKNLSSIISKWAVLAGVFFGLSVITNPACIFLGLIPHIYYLIKSKNIALFYNFLFFVLGSFIITSPFAIISLINNKNLSYVLPFASTFSPFAQNFGLFISSPLNYFKTTIAPFFAYTIAHPTSYALLKGYSYLHYVIITLSMLGILYAFVEEKIRLVFLIFLTILIQALFMPISFEFLFILIIFIASYMVDKTVKDVFC